MLNRRQLRIKVFQCLYAYFCSGETNVAVAEKELNKCINATFELMIWQLSLLTELHYHAERRMEDAKNKFMPTEEDLNPNLRFLNNRVILQLNDNRNYKQLLDDFHVSWLEHGEAIRRIFNAIKSSEDYAAYLASSDNYADDKKFIVDIFQNFIFEDDFLIDLYETKNIYWYTDFFLSQFTLMKFLDNLTPNFGTDAKIENSMMQKESTQYEEDKVFARELLCNTIKIREHTLELIKGKIINWEMDRIATADVIILQMAITELTEFPSIPVKVTINEYIEMSKAFSSSKSKIFINGVLDKLISDLTESGEIRKTGRGLM